MSHRNRRVANARVIFALALAVACGLPRDSDGTLDRIRGGTMRVGFAVDTPWVTDSSGMAGGVEGRIVNGLARSLGARVTWTHGHESELLTALHDRELDLVVGGLSADSPWKKHVAFTKPYHVDSGHVVRSLKAKRREEKHVLALPPGENGWLVYVERFLREERALLASALAAREETR
ncbi:MAG TPA: ABC transporter substrate-binding protein [Gemmatimonadaceae bacterium]|nr:ABC transporter substrate-binding protein [Gemmatimonadaceae bacterium]